VFETKFVDKVKTRISFSIKFVRKSCH